jgi:hypothetical protein
MISYTIDCSIITTYIDYGFTNINLEHFSDFSFNVSDEISSNNAITVSVNNSYSSGTINESTVKTISSLTNNSTPAINSTLESYNSTSSTSNSLYSNQNNKTFNKINNSYYTDLISSKAANAAIITTSLSVGKLIMNNMSNLQFKAMVVCSSIKIGASLILIKNAVSNLSFYSNSKKKINLLI